MIATQLFRASCKIAVKYTRKIRNTKKKRKILTTSSITVIGGGGVWIIVIGVRSTRSVVDFREKMFTIIVFKIVGPKIRLCAIFDKYQV